MKKLIALLLCLTLVLPAFAKEPESFTIPGENKEVWVQTLPLKGGMLCRVEDGKSYYYLNPKGTALEPLSVKEPKPQDIEEGARYFQLIAIAEDAGKSYALLLTQANLYALPLELSGDTLTFGKAVKMDCEHRIQYYEGATEGEQNAHLSVGDRHILVGDTLYVSQYGTQDNRELDSFNILTGEYTPCDVKRMISILPYKDGKLLMIQSESEDMSLGSAVFVASILNPDDFSTEEFARLGPNCQSFSSGSLFYEEKTDSLLYSNNMQIYRLHRNGEEELCGYKPSKYMPLMMLKSGQLVGMAQAKVLFISTDGSKLPTAELRMYHVSGDEKARTALNDIMFIDVEEFQDNIALGQALVSGALQVDVMNLVSDYNTPTPLVQKGYLADLQDVPGLKEYMDSLYPFLSEPFMKDDAIYALPWSIHADCFACSQKVLKELNYEAPKTFADFCEIITDFLENHADDSQYALFDTPVSGQWFLSWMVRLYLYARLQMGLPLALDTPEFREMAAAYESLPAFFRAPDIKEMSEEEWEEAWMELQDKQVLFYTYSGVSPMEISSMLNEIKSGLEDIYGALPLMLSPWEGAPTVLSFYTNYLCVFAQSLNLDNAKRYIEERVQSIHKNSLAAMVENYSEPVENAYYESNIKSMQEHMASLKEEIEKAEGAQKTQLEKEYEQVQKNLKYHQEYWRYDVTKEALEYYQNIVMTAPLMETGHPLLAWDGPLHELSSRFFSGQMSMDQFIKEFDQKSRLITLEQQ